MTDTPAPDITAETTLDDLHARGLIPSTVATRLKAHPIVVQRWGDDQQWHPVKRTITRVGDLEGIFPSDLMRVPGLGRRGISALMAAIGAESWKRTPSDELDRAEEHPLQVEGDLFGDATTLDALYVHKRISTRTYNALAAEGYKTVGGLRSASQGDLLRLPNFGPHCLREVAAILEPGSPAAVSALSIAELRDRGLISQATYDALAEHNDALEAYPEDETELRRPFETVGQLVEAMPEDLLRIPGIDAAALEDLFPIVSHCWADGPDIILKGGIRYIRVDSLMERLWAKAGFVRDEANGNVR